MYGPCNSAGIHTVDISAFDTDADPKERHAAAKQLGEAAAQHGCAAIIGHGISLERLHEAFDLVRRFYGMPGEDKMKAPRPSEVMHHRGYSMPGRERVAGKESLESEDADAKERLKQVADYKVSN
jgi:isopenicillin N synthase-like dioxygenase